jgi:hypothetical protein
MTVISPDHPLRTEGEREREAESVRERERQGHTGIAEPLRKGSDRVVETCGVSW